MRIGHVATCLWLADPCIRALGHLLDYWLAAVYAAVEGAIDR